MSSGSEVPIFFNQNLVLDVFYHIFHEEGFKRVGFAQLHETGVAAINPETRELNGIVN